MIIECDEDPIMMIDRNKLINDAIKADIDQSRCNNHTGYDVSMCYKNVEVIAELLGIDKENLCNQVNKNFS